MKLEILQKETYSQNAPQKKQSVVIAANLVRQREMLDSQGNVIDMRTKQIIKLAHEE